MAGAMTTLLKGGTLADLSSGIVRRADLVIDGGDLAEIVETGDCSRACDDIVDCSGMVILPGLAIGHTHLYSALAVGMPPPKKIPTNFVEILEQIWWKLDRALDEEGVYMSALVGASRAALCGATTLVDHHASPNAIAGSLDLVKRGIDEVGMRGVLCYEVTDRNGMDGAHEGVKENARFLASNSNSTKFAGLIGAHASFTLGDESLSEIADLADECSTGVHIHCAEDLADVEDCRRRFGKSLAGHLLSRRIVRPGSIFAHCTHLPESEIQVLHDNGCFLAHNTRSNMNNAVGYAPISKMSRGKLALGTDGIDGDMFAESKTSFFKMRDAGAGLGFADAAKWVVGAAEMASHFLKTPLGQLEPGAAADLCLLDYDQRTPVDSANLLGHWFFGFSGRHVHSVMCDGNWIVRNRQLTSAAARRELERANETSMVVWKRFAEL